MFIAFWWGVLLKRKDLLALLSLDAKTASPSGIDFNGAAGGHCALRALLREAAHGRRPPGARRLGRGATAAPRAVGRAAGRWGGRKMDARRLGQSDAARQFAGEQLKGLGRACLEQRNADEHRAELAKADKVFDQEKRTPGEDAAGLDSQVKRPVQPAVARRQEQWSERSPPRTAFEGT